MQLSATAVYLNCSLEVVIVHRWQVHAGKQITQDSVEEGNILVQKLGQVDIIDGPQHEHILSRVREGALEVARSTQNTDHSSHAVVVVVLATQLLTAQPAAQAKASSRAL